MSEIPLFPLHTVLFPQGILSLRIFEPRYIDMISACLKTDTGFGVCLIRDGNEVGAAAEFYTTGTLAKITDWHTLPDGLLGITALGQQRFAVLSQHTKPNQLITAAVEMIANEPECEIPALYSPLVDLLSQVLAQLGPAYAEMYTKYSDASWVGCRLTELLPLAPAVKQELLQLNNPVQRLERLYAVLENLAAEQAN